MSLLTDLTVGQLDCTEMTVLALLVSALLSVIPQAEDFVAVLGGQVFHGQCSARVIGDSSDSLDNPFSLAVLSFLTVSFSAFALRPWLWAAKVRGGRI